VTFIATFEELSSPKQPFCFVVIDHGGRGHALGPP
jgi:hypothetical protein